MHICRGHFWLQGPSVPEVAGDRMDTVSDQRGAGGKFNPLRQRMCMSMKVTRNSKGPVNQEREVVKESCVIGGRQHRI